MAQQFIPANDHFVSQLVKATKAMVRFNRSLELLIKWRDVRPAICPSQCEYSRGLLLTMLVAAEELVPVKGGQWSSVVEDLREILSRPPPRTPNTTVHSDGRFL
jgi:hypothetical protein